MCYFTWHFTSMTKTTALSTAAILSAEILVILSTKIVFQMVRISPRFTAHSVGIPSSVPDVTSTGIWRTVRVTGANVIEILIEQAMSRESRRTDRFPAGEGSSAHPISPGFTYHDSFGSISRAIFSCVSAISQVSDVFLG